MSLRDKMKHQRTCVSFYLKARSCGLSLVQQRKTSLLNHRVCETEFRHSAGIDDLFYSISTKEPDHFNRPAHKEEMRIYLHGQAKCP